MELNRDKHGIIGQIQSDGSIEGGDAANWNGHFEYLTDELLQLNFVETFEVGFGAYVRHPYPEQTNNGFGAYYKNPWNGCISRDQLIGIIAALIKKKEYLALLRLILHSACRLFLFSYNTIDNGEDPKTAKWKLPDPTFMEVWAMWLRGFGWLSWIAWPLLCILDLQMLIGAYFKRGKPDKEIISFLMKFFVSREYVPTPISKLTASLIDKEEVMQELDNYWCKWRDGCDGFIPLYEKKLDEVL